MKSIEGYSLYMLLKPLKIRPPLYVLLDYFTTRPSFKNLYDTFLTKWPEMLKMCKHLAHRTLISLSGNLHSTDTGEIVDFMDPPWGRVPFTAWALSSCSESNFTMVQLCPPKLHMCRGAPSLPPVVSLP